MIRSLFERVLLFGVPFLLYGAYLVFLRLRPQSSRPATPWNWLIVAGLALVAISFVVVGLFEG